MKHDGKGITLAVGDVVMIHSEDRKRGNWLLGIIEVLYTGRDRVVHGARLRAGSGHIERPVNHFYPLGLTCNRRPSTFQDQLNQNVPEFRPARDAAVAASVQILDIAND